MHSTDGPLKWADLSSVIKLNQVKTKALDNCSDSSRALKALPVAEESDPGPASLNHTAQREQSQTAMSCLTTTGTTASGFLIWKSHCSRPGLGGGGTVEGIMHISCQAVGGCPFKHMAAQSCVGNPQWFYTNEHSADSRLPQFDTALLCFIIFFFCILIFKKHTHANSDTGPPVTTAGNYAKESDGSYCLCGCFSKRILKKVWWLRALSGLYLQDKNIVYWTWSAQVYCCRTLSLCSLH